MSKQWMCFFLVHVCRRQNATYSHFVLVRYVCEYDVTVKADDI